MREEELTEGKEERRPSPVASISRSVSSVPFSLDLADVNNRTRIVPNLYPKLYRGNPVNIVGIYFKKLQVKIQRSSKAKCSGRMTNPPQYFANDAPIPVLS